MKHLLSKEHYHYKIYTLLVKSKASYPSFYRNFPHIWAITSPLLLQKDLDTPSMIHQKSQPPINKGGGSHYEYYI